jgi:hypothetical protein
MKKILSKKEMLLKRISCMAMILAINIFSQQAQAQEDGIYFRTVFEVRDAVGNTDTVVFIVKEGATSGIDTELGEVNLFGQEPTTDLDLRIIQRTTINCTENGLDYWLCNVEPPSEENIDLKIDYRFDDKFHEQEPYSSYRCYYVLKVYAKHYPVSIYMDKNLWDNHFEWSQFKEENGKYVEGTYNRADFTSPPFLLYTFNDASENNLILFSQERHVSVEDVMYKQPSLYPNPASEFVIIEDGKYGETFTISDTNGRIVKTVTVESYPYSLDIRDLLKGAYFLKNREGTTIYSFIKE